MFKLPKPWNRNRRKTTKHLRRSLCVEALEDRMVPSTASLSGGILTYNAAAGEVNDLTISESAGVLTLLDTGATITAGPEFTVVGPNEVTIPTAGITSGTANLSDMDDQALTDRRR